MRYRSDLFKDIDILVEGLDIETPGGFGNDPNEFIITGDSDSLKQIKNDYEETPKNVLYKGIEKMVMGKGRLIIKYKGEKSPTNGKNVRIMVKNVSTLGGIDYDSARLKMRKIAGQLPRKLEVGDSPYEYAALLRKVYEKNQEFIDSLADAYENK